MSLKAPSATKTRKTKPHLFLADKSPKWVRIYDNGGETADRYTVLFVKKAIEVFEGIRYFSYLSMSAEPTHPQGFCQHGESSNILDTNSSGYSPAIGRKCHLGRRIPFSALPEACQKIVISDYKEIWDIKA